MTAVKVKCPIGREGAEFFDKFVEQAVKDFLRKHDASAQLTRKASRV